jgi:glycerophosphoryl diester phosphodiesterase
MLVFAHRGASLAAPENTLKAIALAIEQSSHGVEVDLRQHNDEFLILHDPCVDRTTNGSGQIDSLDFSQIRNLDAGEGQMIPTLQEVLKLVRNKILLNLEFNHCALKCTE